MCVSVYASNGVWRTCSQLNSDWDARFNTCHHICTTLCVCFSSHFSPRPLHRALRLCLCPCVCVCCTTNVFSVSFFTIQFCMASHCHLRFRSGFSVWATNLSRSRRVATCCRDFFCLALAKPERMIRTTIAPLYKPRANHNSDQILIAFQLEHIHLWMLSVHFSFVVIDDFHFILIWVYNKKRLSKTLLFFLYKHSKENSKVFLKKFIVWSIKWSFCVDLIAQNVSDYSGAYAKRDTVHNVFG